MVCRGSFFKILPHVSLSHNRLSLAQCSLPLSLAPSLFILFQSHSQNPNFISLTQLLCPPLLLETRKKKRLQHPCFYNSCSLQICPHAAARIGNEGSVCDQGRSAIRSALQCFGPNNPYANPVMMLEHRQYLVGEKWIAIETAKIIREKLKWCYRIEGINHLQKCKHLRDQYLEATCGIAWGKDHRPSALHGIVGSVLAQ